MDELGIGGDPRGYLINGRPLRELVDLRGLVFVTDYVPQLLLRKPSPLASGRVPLYVCNQCGDLGCGAITVRVTAVDDCIVWSDFQIESYDGASPIETERDYYFPRAQYFATIY